MKLICILLLLSPISSFCQSGDYISNNDYNEFVTYVRDSLIRYTLGTEVDEEEFIIFPMNEEGDMIGVNWKPKVDLNSPECREALEPFYYNPKDRIRRNREFDPRKFIHIKINIYPDVLTWCRQSYINKSWALFLTKYYFIHPFFKDYPVVGLSQNQIKEYIKWKHPNNNKKIDQTNDYELKLVLPKKSIQLTTKDFFEFYEYTKDSIFRMKLCKELDEYKYCKSVNKYSEVIEPPIVKWKYKIKWNNERVLTIFKNAKLLTSDEKIDNVNINYTYQWYNYYEAISHLNTVNRSKHIMTEKTNVWVKKYLEIHTPVKTGKRKKTKAEIDYNSFDVNQLRAFYYWKNSRYPSKDVFDGFIPYSTVLVEGDTIKKEIDNDINLIKKNELPNEFYNFNTKIKTTKIN
jgi:hypothetical protein